MILSVTLLSLFLVVLIAVDCRTFEIDFAALAMVAFNGICLNLYLKVPIEDMILGSVCWAIAWGVIRWVLGRHAIGQGDLWLFATLGLLSGLSGSVLAVAVFFGLSLVTAQSYRIARSRSRGVDRARLRRMRRRFELHPAALPAGMTLFAIFIMRLAGIGFLISPPMFWLDRGPAINAALRAGIETWGAPIAVLAMIAAVAWTIHGRRDVLRSQPGRAREQDVPPC
ncbi:hypothetical protein [Ruegeria atlantica]|uniref:hypothetical protein n=1 Tax=Ruegeria atlantica TaxID=81569 RepID=UPI00147F8D70|nr:hypothetical protein [Ruegeria atlantica]